MDEVLQPSSLRTYRWPDEDPTSVDQRVRVVTPADIETIRLAANTLLFDWERFEKNTKSMDVAQKIYYVVTHPKVQFNPTHLVRQEALWLDRIRDYVRHGRPIHMIFPLMCKINNWAKQHVNIGPSAGEEVSLQFFARINDVVRRIYEPGIRIAVVCDAALYNSAFGNAEVEVKRYMQEVAALVNNSPEVSQVVEFLDYTELLAPAAHRYAELHRQFYRLVMDNSTAALAGINQVTLFESVRASVNTRRLGMSYIDHREIFGPNPNPANQYFDYVHQMATQAFNEVVAIRLACSQLNIFESIWPQHVRLTCHKGPKNNRYIIALRPYPEYYNGTKLLPYHGVPVIWRDHKRPKLEIHPEFILRGRRDLVRVVTTGEEVYFYDGTEAQSRM